MSISNSISTDPSQFIPNQKLKLTAIPSGPGGLIMAYADKVDSLAFVCRVFEDYIKSFYNMRYSTIKEHFSAVKRVSKLRI